jgi:hypothetical protein
VRGDHPCFRHGEDRGLYVLSGKIKDNDSYVPLRDKNDVVITRADHYREMCLHEPWKVPLLFGSLPKTPKAESDVSVKGGYALVAMLLLRPWRDPFLAIHDWIGPPSTCQFQTTDALWSALDVSFKTWRAEVHASTFPFFSKDPRAWLPAPEYNSDAWWNCRVHKIANNMDLAFARPGDNSAKMPDSKDVPSEDDFDSSCCSQSAAESIKSGNVSEGNAFCNDKRDIDSPASDANEDFGCILFEKKILEK